MFVFKKVLFIVMLLVLSKDFAFALPAHRRVFEGKYGYKMSCAVCHSKGGGSELNDYGKHFQRAGLTPGAFKTIEQKDSDGDKSLNIDEIKAKSNPGDPRSIPNNPGDWLQKIEEASLPLEQLEKLFPGTKKFSSLEGTLLPSQVSSIEKVLAESLTEYDKVPTFYFSVLEEGKKFKRTGVSLFISAKGPKDIIITAVAVDLSGKVQNVVLVKNKEGETLSQESFLGQFKGMKTDDDFGAGKTIKVVSGLDKPSGIVAESVRKGLLVLGTVFGKKTK